MLEWHCERPEDGGPRVEGVVDEAWEWAGGERSQAVVEEMLVDL